MNINPIRFIAVASALCLGLVGCASGPKGVGPLPVDDVNQMLEKSTAKLLEAEKAARGPSGGAESIWVVCFPTKVKGSVELGSSATFYDNTIEEQVANSGLFRPVARNLIDVVCTEINLADPEKLVLTDKREQFISKLTEQGAIPDYFIIAELATLEMRDGGYVSQRDVKLTLKLLHSKTYELAQQKSDSIKQRSE